MCTLTYIPKDEGFVWTHNRDESPKRIAGQLVQKETLLYPEEPISKGSWISLAKNGTIASILNGAWERQSYEVSTVRSRGLLLLDFFEYEDIHLARTCVKMDDIERKEEGKKILQELIEKHPKDGLIWNSWADYLWNVEHNYKATEEAYLQGLKVAPKNSYLLGNLGELYIDIYNRLDEGFMLYEEALAQQQSIYRLTTVVTAFVHKAQDWKKAKKYYQMLLKKFAPASIKRDSYLRDNQWNDFLTAEALLKKELKKK